MRKRWAVTVVLLHALVIACLLWTPSPKAPPSAPPVEVTITDSSNPTLADAIDGNGRPCSLGAYTYLGMGVVYEWTERGAVIVQAPPHLPAGLAGIQVGDVVESLPDWEPYRAQEVVISRRGAEMRFRVTPRQICYTEGNA